ncbi:MAG: hypothetical protein ACE3JP_11120 [Ectobacillus sp.]
MLCSFPHPHRFPIAKVHTKEKEHHSCCKDKHEQKCDKAFTRVGNTFTAPNTFTVGTTIPLSSIRTNGFRTEGNSLFFKNCGTFAISLKVTSANLDAGSSINLIKLGCRGRTTLGSVQVLTTGSQTFSTEDCFQFGDRLQLEVGGTDIILDAGDLLDVELIATQTSCCCDDPCDRCGCPCKKKHKHCC